MNIDSMYTHSQRGATLVIALIILLIMSLIGISNMQSSTMQERMAANNRQKTVALYAAESALTAAEEWVQDNVRSVGDLLRFSGSDGLYSRTDVSSGISAAPLLNHVADVTDPDSWGDFGVSSIGETPIVDINLVSQQPRYVIEYIGIDKGTAGSDVSELNADTHDKPSIAYMFRITAIGWGKDDNIYTVLESVIRTGSGEFFSY
ncbi:pilus assembly PilX family protein [Teredinibacter franksiae]|uniref:pilus assembly PilX family protein n=1 Tax=Teredinibacter franksiae TaxID=2761453 RepID=UPI0028B16753|nr:PilX N-terminal domain-containing pilus assembly protein [Teredinibacter franksiae]